MPRYCSALVVPRQEETSCAATVAMQQHYTTHYCERYTEWAKINEAKVDICV